jgi:hypothetical protein
MFHDVSGCLLHGNAVKRRGNRIEVDLVVNFVVYISELITRIVKDDVTRPWMLMPMCPDHVMSY